MNLNSKFLPDCWWHIYILQVIHVVPSLYHYKLLIPLIVLVCLFCILHFAFFFVHSEVEFVHAVSAGGSVKFLPAV